MNNEVRHTSQGASMNPEPPLFPSVHVDLDNLTIMQKIKNMHTSQGASTYES